MNATLFPPPSLLFLQKHYYTKTTKKVSLPFFILTSLIVPILILGTFFYLGFSPFLVFAYCLVRNTAKYVSSDGCIFMFFGPKFVHCDPLN